MKTKMSEIFHLIAVVSLALAFLNTGCDKNSTDPKQTAPDLPPTASFVMDFSDFAVVNPSPAAPQVSGQFDQTLTKQNWGWAAGNVGVWNTLITVGLAVPVAAFMESFKHEAVLQTDGSWVWSYSFTVLGIIHNAKLQAKVTDQQVQWDMYISKQDAYTDFHWYTGTSNLPPTHGTWTLYNSPDNPAPLLGIEWNRDAQTSTGDIKYTNIVPEGAENGGYIYYGVTQDTVYNAFYDIYNKGKDNTTNIRWNRTEKYGQVKDPQHFGDSEWHCWDSHLDDIACQ
ncbi:MAG: hypothetical protein P8184_19235 [Calditrichia bacterium]